MSRLERMEEHVCRGIRWVRRSDAEEALEKAPVQHSEADATATHPYVVQLQKEVERLTKRNKADAKLVETYAILVECATAVMHEKNIPPDTALGCAIVDSRDALAKRLAGRGEG